MERNFPIAGLPVTTWIIVLWLIFHCISIYDADAATERKREGLSAELFPPNWLVIAFYLKYALLLSMLYFDGSYQRPLAVWAITTIASIFFRSVFGSVGMVLCLPLAWLLKRKKG